MNIIINAHQEEREANGLARIIIDVPELGISPLLDIAAEDLIERCGVADPIAFDLLLVASACYVVDKMVPRSLAADNWTRDFEVFMPVSNASAWNRTASDLQMALGFLTGDAWNLKFQPLGVEFFKPPEKSARRRARVSRLIEGATSACLFSGGLDSLAGALDLLAGGGSGRTLLVGHYDAAGPAKSQKDLFEVIKAAYPGRSELIQTRVGHRPRRAAENSLRSRSLVFMALGLYAARTAGPATPLYAPENGLIAINIPLTPSRSGSCSTRTMHPFFLSKLADVLKGLNIENEIVNPYQLKTKGECVAECGDLPVLRSLAELSVSCSHASRKQNWVRRGAKNCGYCVPCLIRRAALHRAGLDDGESYGIDVCRDEMSVDDALSSADDLRAVADFLRGRRMADEFRREILRTAPVERPEETARMLERGFEEIRALFRDKAERTLREAAGIVKL
jgi:hypothetical protein